MKENRATTLDSILSWEGGDLNLSPGEPGGASKFGISVNFLSDYRFTQGQPKASISDVSNLTADDARNIYDVMLLSRIRFDDLPPGVDYRLADIATNSGMTGGPQLLQLALGMFPLSGSVDQATIAAAKAADPKALVIALSAAWIANKHASPSWGPNPPITKTGFGHGWSNRNNAQKEAALLLIK
jgi:lysozyme family protein